MWRVVPLRGRAAGATGDDDHGSAVDAEHHEHGPTSDDHVERAAHDHDQPAIRHVDDDGTDDHDHRCARYVDHDGPHDDDSGDDGASAQQHDHDGRANDDHDHPVPA
jgi:hypothetical protein